MPVTIQPTVLRVKQADGHYEAADCLQGQQGDAGPGVASGGTTGQVIKKKSNADYDTEWGAESVQDVQVNGTSVLSNGVANVPVANDTYGVVKVTASNYGIGMLSGNNNGILTTRKASDANIKSAYGDYAPIVATNQHTSAFYGLAKAAGDSTQSQSSNEVGAYTDSAKSAIQHMLGTDINLAPYEFDITADAAYAIGEMFMLNGKLHKATAAIAVNDIFTEGTNCVVVNASEVFPHDVQVNGTSVVTNGVANVPAGSDSDYGVFKLQQYGGLQVGSNGLLKTAGASSCP